MIPRILIVVIFATAFGIHLSRHGEKRQVKYDWVLQLIRTVIIFTILYFGGFWEY